MALATSLPQTPAQIKAHIDALQSLISTYIADPVKFAEQIGGSIKISIPDYVRELREQIEYWTRRYESTPSFEQNYFEQEAEWTL